MSSASERLYSGYLRRRMPTIVSTVKAREIVVHLPCLTPHDRENIEAKRENYGNFDAMVLLLDCLKRRDSWPEQFIQALESCEYLTIAAEVRAEYLALRGADDSNAGPSSATVTTAHVHPAPTQTSVQETVSPTAAAAAAQTTPPQALTSTDQLTGSPKVVSEPPEAVPLPSEVVPPPSEVVPPLSQFVPPPSEVAPPPSEVVPPPSEVVPPPSEVVPPPSEVVPPPSEVVPSSEAVTLPFQSVPPPSEVVPPLSEVEPPPSEVVPSSVAVPPPSEVVPPPSEVVPTLSEVIPPPSEVIPPSSEVVPTPAEALLRVEVVSTPEPVPEPLQSAPVMHPVSPPPPPSSPEPPLGPQEEFRPHQEPEETTESDIQVIVGVTVLPPETGPVKTEVLTNVAETPPPNANQSESDTPSKPDPPPQNPTRAEVTPNPPEGSSFLTLTPEKAPVQETAPPVVMVLPVVLEPEEPEEASESPVDQDPEGITEQERVVSSLCLSKPAELISVDLPNHGPPTLSAQTPPAGPYSGDSGRLEISESMTDVDPALCGPIHSADPGPPPCQENGLDHMEPEENHYESLCQSLDPLGEVRENVVQISEEASILNLEGPTSGPHIVNGEAAGKMAPPPPRSSITDDTGPSPAPSVELQTLLEPEKAEQRSCRVFTDSRYLVTAAGVGALALLMAWKFKS